MFFGTFFITEMYLSINELKIKVLLGHNICKAHQSTTRIVQDCIIILGIVRYFYENWVVDWIRFGRRRLLIEADDGSLKGRSVE